MPNEVIEIQSALDALGWTRAQFTTLPNIPYYAIMALSPDGWILSGSGTTLRGAYDSLVAKNLTVSAAGGLV